MSYKSIVISSGHGKYIRGAAGVLDEVDEAREVVKTLHSLLVARGVAVKTFHDDVSETQSDNLERIVNYHNSQQRELDISVHFNAYVETEKPMGTEVLYVSQQTLAGQLSAAISDAGELLDRGCKRRSDLYFLNNTDMPAVLLEVCFVDSEADAELYRENFEEICEAIADVLGGEDEDDWPVPPIDFEPLFVARGTVSWFGGPNDPGVSPSEGLAFHYELTEDNQHLFLPLQPEDTSGLARRLNPFIHYVACRWDYNTTPKAMLAGDDIALVRAIRTGIELTAFPADWGPHEEKTGRAADISPGLMADLGIQTDDEVEVIYPYSGNNTTMIA
jgi:hypothetical protein